MTPNAMTVNLKLKRIEICDLLIACTVLAEETEAKKWAELHDKLEAILGDFDEAHGIGIFEQ